MSKGIIYLVGAGPGDPKLISVKGLELIKKADCIIYDYLVNSELLKLRKPDCKLIYVGKKASFHTLSQSGINELLVKEAKTHNIVVRLKGGDPFVFGRGAEEAVFLKENKIDFNIVPGITSAIAVPAYAGIPITERSRNSTVGFITGHEDPTKIDSNIDWEALVKALGTMVFLMGVGNLDLIVKRIIDAGKPVNTPVALIRWGTTPKQKTLTGTLSNIVSLAKVSKIAPPVVIVVGETVALREKLNWFEKNALFSKKILVTRTREQASILSEKLRDFGAEVMEIPTIKTISLNADAKIKTAFYQKAYDWVFFTSQNGVQEFADILERLGKDSRILDKARICAIGTETAKSLQRIGLRPDYVPAEFVAEAVVEHFKKLSLPPPLAGQASEAKQSEEKVLILRAKKARDVLPEGLRAAGFKVDLIDLYDTVVPKESALSLKKALKERLDYVTFTSSSTVDNFIQLLGKDYRRKIRGVKFASIGPVTSKTLKKYGLRADVEAKIYTIDGLVEAMERVEKL